MDNKKIGNLISKLRKEKGLTQQALGDLVGVGSGAVSKWERGITLPDIGIINELSQILGISSDELLSGEIKEEIISENDITDEYSDSREQCKINKYNIKKILLISIPLILIIIIILILVIYNKNKTYAYNIISTSDEYYVDGKVIFRGDRISIIVNKISFFDEEFNSIIIKNYEYEISSNGKYLFGYGYINLINIIDEEQTIEKLFENFLINYKGQSNLLRNKIVKNNIIITIKFQDQNNNEIIKDIEFSLDTIET